jgi:hypothetical protein
MVLCNPENADFRMIFRTLVISTEGKINLVFEPINLDRQTDYLELLSNCPQVASDYSFLNLWA